MRKKLKRTMLSFFPVQEGRTGECNNCGACCRLPYKCPFLKTTEEDGETKEYCSIYVVRPPNCRKFPRTEEEHSLVSDVCGFSFPEQGEGKQKKFVQIFPKN